MILEIKSKLDLATLQLNQTSNKKIFNDII